MMVQHQLLWRWTESAGTLGFDDDRHQLRQSLDCGDGRDQAVLYMLSSSSSLLISNISNLGLLGTVADQKDYLGWHRPIGLGHQTTLHAIVCCIHRLMHTDASCVSFFFEI
jgi:hypothetical protein